MKEKTASAPSPVREEAPRRRKKAALLWSLFGLLVVLVLALLLLGILTIRYQDRFYPRTTLEGVDVSGMTPRQAHAALRQSAQEAQVQLWDGEAKLCAISLGDLTPDDVLVKALNQRFYDQHGGNPFRWLAPGGNYADVVIPGVSEALAASLVEKAQYAQGRTEPQDAYVLVDDAGYTLVAEVEGNLLHTDLCAAAIAQALTGMDDLSVRTVDVQAPGARILPEVTAQDPALLAECKTMDGYLNPQVTLDFQNGTTYTLTPEDIWSVTRVVGSGNAARYEPDMEKVRALTDALAEEYGMDGVYAKFHNAEPTRELIYYRVGDQGWRMDRALLAQDTAEAIAKGGASTVYPDYDRTWYWQNYYGIGNTFVEISIDNQYMWYFIDGQLIVETPVVTGNLAAGDYTRKGCFKIYGMVTDTTLTGPTWRDHVDYWMPFDGAIGLHDSSWRDEYGGDIYISDGSHGCINTPLEAIRTIYENIWEGVPVVVY